ncbi:aspartyl protease family protein [Candidatus Woesearchaeota archaeon]|nr:aspartyl protease family protein [Candidatus Woesearchaeota archaeon]
MGHVYVEVEISNLEGSKSAKVQAMVDTGAHLTVVPSKLAAELGIKPFSEDNVATGAGLANVKTGAAWIKIKGKAGVFNVWVSQVIDRVLLGVVVLETLGFDVDARKAELKEAPMLMYGIH